MKQHAWNDAASAATDLPDRISRVLAPMARSQPNQLALVGDGEAWTYAQLAALVARTADGLKEVGVRPGDRVLIVSENSLALAAILFAASEIDAWVTVVNPRLSDREIDQIRDHSGARRVFFVVGVGEQAALHAKRHNASGEDFAGLSGVAVGPLNLSAEPEPVEASGAKQVAVLLYTSGTTGAPKGVMLTHHNILFNGRTVGQIRKLGPADRNYGVLPMSHIVGLSNTLVGSLMFGCTVQVVPKFDPAHLIAAIDDGVTILQGVPATYQRLLEYKSIKGLGPQKPNKLRFLSVSGAPLDLALKTRVENDLGLPLCNGYGITECSPGVCSIPLGENRADESVGKLIPGIEGRLVGPHGSAVAAGEVGELHICGPNVMKGYYRAPEATAAALSPDGWFNTGDLARFDGDYGFIVGRTKELIIRSGFNVYPPEVEAVLSAHRDVVQSAVVGRAIDGNEEVVAFVQLLPGATTTAADLRAFAASQLAAYKRPAEIILLDALPASSTGKILKHLLPNVAAQSR